jgi:hypothetical protein
VRLVVALGCFPFFSSFDFALVFVFVFSLGDIPGPFFPFAFATLRPRAFPFPNTLETTVSGNSLTSPPLVVFTLPILSLGAFASSSLPKSLPTLLADGKLWVLWARDFFRNVAGAGVLGGTIGPTSEWELRCAGIPVSRDFPGERGFIRSFGSLDLETELAGGDGNVVSREETVTSDALFLVPRLEVDDVLNFGALGGVILGRLGLRVGAEDRLPRAFETRQSIPGLSERRDAEPLVSVAVVRDVALVGVSTMLMEGLRTGFDLPIRIAGARGSGSMNGRPEMVVTVAFLVARRAARGVVGGVGRASRFDFRLDFVFVRLTSILRFFFGGAAKGFPVRTSSS